MASASQHGSMVKLNKTCDQCRQRKIRCIVPDAPPGDPPTCIYCTKRGQACHFSVFRRKVRVKVPESLPASSQPYCNLALGEIFIDRVLQYGPQNIVLAEEASVFTAPDEQITSSSLAFFSEQKVALLTEKTGDTRLQELVKRLDNHIMTRLGYADGSSWPPIYFRKPKQQQWVSPDEARSYIYAFFTNLHPVYPFLDKEDFETQAFSPNLADILARNHPFSALYHSILALGSQYVQGGTFEPGKGKSWELFQVSLGHMADIILPRESLVNVQALAAMSIYVMNTCGLQLEEVLISHAARMVIMLRYHKHANSEPKHLRLFWVIYALEKQQAIHSRTCSIIPDEDIGCAIPSFPEAQVGDFNWVVAFIRIARICSIVSTSLFSISASSLRSADMYKSAMDQIRRILEEWRQAIPVEFRPGDSIHFPMSAPPSVRLAALQLHFSYYHIIIALERLTLHVDRDGGYGAQLSRQRLMNTARTVVELTKYIDIQPHTPIFILVVLPTAAVFILFDFVIHNPHHRESRTNLTLLDAVAGYSSLVDIASNSVLPGGLVSEFAKIAREYYWKSQQAKAAEPQNIIDKTSESGPVSHRPAGHNIEEQGSDFSRTENSQTGSLESTTSLGIQEATDTQMMTPTGSDYLNYPTPMNFEAASDFQTEESGDLRTMFGWVFPEWNSSELDMDSLNLGPQSNPQGEQM